MTIFNAEILTVFPGFDTDYDGRPMALVIYRNRDFEYVQHRYAAQFGFVV